MYEVEIAVREMLAERYLNDTFMTGILYDSTPSGLLDRHEPKLRDIKTSASVAVLAEYMPDTTERGWDQFKRYCALIHEFYI